MLLGTGRAATVGELVQGAQPVPGSFGGYQYSSGGQNRGGAENPIQLNASQIRGQLSQQNMDLHREEVYSLYHHMTDAARHKRLISAKQPVGIDSQISPSNSDLWSSCLRANVTTQLEAFAPAGVIKFVMHPDNNLRTLMVYLLLDQNRTFVKRVST